MINYIKFKINYNKINDFLNIIIATLFILLAIIPTSKSNIFATVLGIILTSFILKIFFSLLINNKSDTYSLENKNNLLTPIVLIILKNIVNIKYKDINSYIIMFLIILSILSYIKFIKFNKNYMFKYKNNLIYYFCIFFIQYSTAIIPVIFLICLRNFFLTNLFNYKASFFIILFFITYFIHLMIIFLNYLSFKKLYDTSIKLLFILLLIFFIILFLILNNEFISLLI